MLAISVIRSKRSKNSAIILYNRTIFLPPSKMRDLLRLHSRRSTALKYKQMIQSMNTRRSPLTLMATLPLSLLLGLVVSASLVESFALPASVSSTTRTVIIRSGSSSGLQLTSTSDDNDSCYSTINNINVKQTSKNVDAAVEIDRRLAMVRAAVALSSGVVTMAAAQQPEPADAIGAFFSLEATVTDLEQKYSSTKNTNGDPTKHTPEVTLVDATPTGQMIKFAVPHVMDFEKPHYIEYMWLEDISGKQKKPPGNIVAVKAFTKPSNKKYSKQEGPAVAVLTGNVASGRLPTLKATIVRGMVLKPCLYCNLHGLWEGEPYEVV